MTLTPAPRRYDLADFILLLVDTLEPLLAPIAEALTEVALFLASRRKPVAEVPTNRPVEAFPAVEVPAPAVTVAAELQAGKGPEPATAAQALDAEPMTAAEANGANSIAPTQPAPTNVHAVARRTEPAKESALFVKLNGRFRPAPSNASGPFFKQATRGGKRKFVRC